MSPNACPVVPQRPRMTACAPGTGHKLAPAVQAVIDALSAHVAILDPEGNIVAVNQAWKDFADANGGSLAHYGIGCNYPAMCLGASCEGAVPGEEDAPAPEVDGYALLTHAGIRRVLDGHEQKFQLVYPCHSPDRKSWYLLTVTPMAVDGSNGAVVAHEDVTTLKQHEEAIVESLVGTVETLAEVVKARDPYTASHEKNVARIADAIAEKMGLHPEIRRGLVLGAEIHDIGKISIPSEILTHPGRLTEIAMDLVRTHSLAGYDLVKNIAFPWPLARIIRQHHERLDGTGYPDGLKGEEICLEARVIAVADVVDAMSSHRPYRPGLGLAAANDEVRSGAGSLYDPEVVEAYLSVEVQAVVGSMYAQPR